MEAVPGKDPSAAAVAHLLANVPELKDDSSYIYLEQNDLLLPGLIFAAFACHIKKLHDQLESDSQQLSAKEELEKSYQVIEELCLLNNNNIDNLIVTEVLENIEYGKHPLVIEMMGKQTHDLYRRWIA